MDRQFIAQCVNSAYAANQRGEHEIALAWCARLLQHTPLVPEIWFNQGLAYCGQSNTAAAIAAFQKAAALSSQNADAQNTLGLKLMELGAHSAAEACLNKAIQLAPTSAPAYFNLGGLLAKLQQLPAAATAFRQAISLAPDLADAYYHLGNILVDLRQPKAAVSTYEQALALNPQYPNLAGTILNTRRLMCEWVGDSAHIDSLKIKISRNEPACPPFVLLSLCDSPRLQRLNTELATTTWYPENHTPSSVSKPPHHDKIRIGYFSADFFNHATAYLMAELFELHDRSRFEIYAFSFGPDKQDAMSTRISDAFDHFISVRNQSDQAIATLSRTLEIDIAVDLKGHTLDSRPGIFSFRPAPIQVNYLGYPGTSGARYFDYIIADPTLIPEGSQQHYCEKIAYLPNSYQVNDTHRPIAAQTVTREEYGLPPTGFVYCCFNNSYKISPETFESWMRILQSTTHSILWLLEDNPEAAANLRLEASRYGVASSRLIFAKRMLLPEHLARHRVADLFLDSWPYNAHTTASDALWAGLPVLTYAGKSFASRVAASLLNAIDLPELVTHNPAEYEALAIDLASHPEKLAPLQQKLAHNRLTAPLFDTALFTRHIEAAFTEMYVRSRRDLPLADIYVAP